MHTIALGSHPLIGRRALIVAGAAALAVHPARGLAGNSSRQRATDALIIDAMGKAKIPGMGVGYAKDGIVQFARGYGLADLETKRRVTPNTVFPLASITKTVTALAIMRLLEAGKLKLDEPVASYLDFSVVNPRHATANITFRHLLTHTSSLSDAKYYEVDTRISGRDATTSLRDHLIGFLTPAGQHYSAAGCYSPEEPGTVWDYSNLGFALLGYLVDRIGGRDGREQITRQMFAPLGMRHCYWTIADVPPRLKSTPYDFVDDRLKPVPPLGLPDWPAGAIRSSVTDFIKLIAAVANGGVSHGIRVLGASGINQMLTIAQPKGLPSWTQGQGLGWSASRLGNTIYPEHWGGSTGIFTAAYLDPPKRTGILILTNVTATPESKSAVKAIAEHLLGQ
jgi:CubicO group peptidase (beta-lactamase class C family)